MTVTPEPVASRSVAIDTSVSACGGMSYTGVGREPLGTFNEPK